MSIEQRIAQILAESKAKDEGAEEIVEAHLAGAESGPNDAATKGEASGDQAVIRSATNVIPAENPAPNEANAKNNAADEKEAEVASKKPNAATAKAEAGDQAVIRQGDAVPATARSEEHTSEPVTLESRMPSSA